jgi:hypothetical protein
VDLVQRITTDVGVEQGLAVEGLGTLFMAIRMGTDAKTFAGVLEAYPDLGQWMQRAPLSARWTGEMLAMATPQAVRRILMNAGYRDEQVTLLCAILGSSLKEHVDTKTYDLITEKLPTLGGE